MTAPPSDRLDSWKAIAAYLDRGVRTVRRWEAEEGLPVHRHMHRALGSVYAFKSEIDAWRASGPRRPDREARPPAGGAKSIVVVPFANLSAAADDAYFADGLTDEVIADLSRVSALRVISRTSSMALKGAARDVRAIARELDVRYVLEGTVRRSGERLRVTAQLIDAQADDHLWSGKYEGTLADVFAIQESLARVIVEALQVHLTADEARGLGARPIRDLRAYECYLQARHQAFRWRGDAIDHAVQLLRNGLAIVGENAELYAALGRAWLQYREAGIDLGERPLREAEACAERVAALDPRSAAGLQLRGWIHYSTGRIQDAVRDLKAALAIEPGSPDAMALLCNCYLISGKVTAARPLIERLLSIDPLTPLTRCLPGFADLMEGDFASALGPYRQMFEMDPGNPMARLFYAWILAANGKVEAAAELARTFPDAVRDTVPARITRFLARAAAGDGPAAREALDPEVESVAQATDLFPRFLALGYARAGMADPALHWLRIAVDRGFINHPFLARHEPFLEPLRGDPRFQGLMDVVRARWERFEP
ncbi:MAG TPA: tetratricopeptide repeat protein [Vicinamibacteria bacterium]|nr:tetratricopeptide repeat protein [Vicinamibacteria bacterium]